MSPVEAFNGQSLKNSQREPWELPRASASFYCSLHTVLNLIRSYRASKPFNFHIRGRCFFGRGEVTRVESGCDQTSRDYA